MHEEYMLGTGRVCTWLRCYSWWPWVLQHIVVPSVASGKSVKLRSPFTCCSVVESLFCECELKDFEAFHGRFLKVTQLWIMYSMTSPFSQCGLHSSGVNFETSLVYCLKSNGHTNFPKAWEPPQNSRYQQHDMKQVLLLTVNKYATVQNVIIITTLHLVFVHPCSWERTCPHARSSLIIRILQSDVLVSMSVQ